MSRPRKPARLWQRGDGAWVILDGGWHHRTGHSGPGGRRAAEEALGRHIALKAARRGRAARPHEITVGGVLADYTRDHGALVASPETLAYCIKALAPFWGDLTVEDVVGANCRAYAAWRATPETRDYVGRNGKRWSRVLTASAGTIRRELGVLTQALKHAVAEGRLTSAPVVTLTPGGNARERWLTRGEAARLILAAAPHLRRFIVISLYTGTRASAVLALRLQPSLTSGWIDADTGIIHRKGSLERETNKRRRSVRMTRRLHAHARRWAEIGGSHAVMWRGRPLAEIDTAFIAAARRADIDSVTIHDLKRTAVTWAFQRGMTLEDAADWFSTSATTLEKYYRAHSPHYQTRAQAIMDSL